MTDFVLAQKVPQKLAEASPRTINQAYRYVRCIAMKNAGNFKYAFYFLPQHQRCGMEALYAFCRIGDDAADDDGLNGASVLNHLRERLDLCYRGFWMDDLTLAMADALRRFAFERWVFDDLFAGLSSDIDFRPFPSWAELSTYCYRVASTIGLHCLKIFGSDTPAARVYAEKLGVAMQLTNILRDIAEDWRRGRIYLPQDELADCGLDPADPLNPSRHHNLRALILRQVKRALGLFNEADRTMPVALSRRLTAARTMGAIYRRLLNKIQSNPTGQRVELMPMEKFGLAAAIFIGLK